MLYTKTARIISVLLVTMLLKPCIDSSPLDYPQANIPHKRVKRSGLMDSEVKPNEAIEFVELDIGKPEYKFRIYRKSVNWKTAHEICDTKEGHMAAFPTKAIADDVVNAIFKMSVFDEDYDWGRKQSEWGLDRRYWIGLTDLFEEGKWAWVGRGQGLAYGTMWYPGQPDHINPDGTIKSGRHQHCGSLWNPAYFKVGTDKKPTEKHTFDDLECERELYFICERDEKKLKEFADKNAAP